MAAVLNRYWRVFATGYCFLSFGLGGSVLSATVLPLIRVFSATQSDKDRRSRWFIHKVFRLFVWQMRVVGVISVEIKNKSLLQETGGKLLVANHPSLIDVVILISLLPRANCIVKQDLWRNPFIKGVVSATGYVSNSSPEQLIDVCKMTMAEGFTLIVFPEGTRTRECESLKFQRGAANIAVRCGVDVIPVTIACSPPMLGKGTKWYRVPPSRGRFVVTAHQSLRVSNVVENGDEPAVATRKFNRYLLEYYKGVLAHG